MCRYGICHIPALAPSLHPKNITFSIFSCRAARKGGWLLGPRQCSTATASQSPLWAPNGAIAWGSNRPSGPQKLYVRFVTARNLVPVANTRCLMCCEEYGERCHPSFFTDSVFMYFLKTTQDDELQSPSVLAPSIGRTSIHRFNQVSHDDEQLQHSCWSRHWIWSTTVSSYHMTQTHRRYRVGLKSGWNPIHTIASRRHAIQSQNSQYLWNHKRLKIIIYRSLRLMDCLDLGPLFVVFRLLASWRFP